MSGLNYSEINGITRERRIHIECLIARGLDAAVIAARLSCPLEDVAAVWQRMDAINYADPHSRNYSTDQAEHWADCGTVGAYRRHLRNKQKPDPDCRTAWAEYRKSTRRRQDAA